jgi:hypothetical protein
MNNEKLYLLYQFTVPTGLLTIVKLRGYSGESRFSSLNLKADSTPSFA